ncbi:uncharacterized protein LOC131685032 [Topomyia yanbarensis]|uniref:uncharacterized protein LOC131685032 n=1 Tax=Topomyia yanbarensis TaxID=2498891 RepID=UPI00273C7CD0|nr:uncharacterized protein LOC131685032 [Topomyia yanbarensis]
MSGKTPKPRRPKKYYGYTNQDINNAISMVVREEFSIRQAAKAFNIPRTTLACYLKNSTGTRKICPMRPEEEDFLLQWMTDCCQRGFSIKKRNVEAAAEQLIRQSSETRLHPFVDTVYYEKFLKRWVSTDRVKDRKVIGVVPDWFSHVDRYLTEGNHNDILIDPNRIFLCDEFKFQERMDVSENIKTSLTETNMLYTITASGNVLQPLIVYPFKGEIPEKIIKSAPKNCAIVPQQHGTVTPKILIAYFKRVLRKFIEQNNIPKPVIVYIDESQIDLTLELTTACKNLDIVILGLTCQVMKPTVSLFRDLATGWTDEVQRWCQMHGQCLPIEECARIMQSVNQKFINRLSITKDFQDSALFPWRFQTDNSVAQQIRPIFSEDFEDDDLEIEEFLKDVSEDEDDDDDDDDGIIPEKIDIDVQQKVDTTQTVTGIDSQPQPIKPPTIEENFIAESTIRLKYGNFQNMLGKELTEKCSKNYTSTAPTFSSRAERVLFDIYRKFRNTQNQAANIGKNDVIEIVEIGDD